MEDVSKQKVLCFCEGIFMLAGIKSLLGAMGLDWASMTIEDTVYNDLLSQIAAWTLHIIFFIIGFVLIIRAIKSLSWLGYFIDALILIGCVCLICLYPKFMVLLSTGSIALGVFFDMYRIYSTAGLNDGLGYLWRKDNIFQ